MKTLVIATRNMHKVQEIRAILGEAFGYLNLDDLATAPEVIEDAATFAGNATRKSVALANWLAAQPERSLQRTMPEALVLADDSGLEVDALRGAPGVHSARFAALDTGAKGNSSTEENNKKLLRLLGHVPKEARRARFRCVVALTPVPAGQGPDSAWANASPTCYANEAELMTRLFEGTCEGRIAEAPRGGGGFGYDPLFIPEGYDQTFGELSEETKNRLSHRAKALAGLKQALRS